MMFMILILGTLGFGISLYAYITEQKVKLNPAYKPVCDLSDRISCSKPMKSPYATIFFLSNAVVALFFYMLIVILALLNATKLIMIAATVSCIVSCGLAYLLFFKIKSLCILCTSLYIINFLLLICSMF